MEKAYHLLKQGLLIANSISNLSRLTKISKSTLTRIATGNYRSVHSTRLRLSAFIEQNTNKRGRPFGKSANSARNLKAGV